METLELLITLMAKKYKLGIFVEAGGNMVFFSNGVLKALKKRNIKANYIAGFSSSAAIMFGYILDCNDFILEDFKIKLNNNKKNFYFFKKEHFPHNQIYKSSVEKIFLNFGRNALCFDTDFTVIAAITSKKWIWAKGLSASLILLLRNIGIDIRRYFNKACKIKLFEAGSEFKNKTEELINIIIGSSCLWPFIKLHFWKDKLVLDGGLVYSSYKKYLEQCEKGIVIHTDRGKTSVRNNILHFYASQDVPFNVLDYTDGSKLEIMHEAGEREVFANQKLLDDFIG